MIPRERLAGLSTETLLQLNAEIVDIVKERKRTERRRIARQLKPGDLVEWTSNRFDRVICGKVESVAITNAKVMVDMPDFERNGIWTVPTSMLRIRPNPDIPQAGTVEIPRF